MPIKPENAKRYPKDWPEISQRIRFGRAAGRCECRGECGIDHDGRCAAEHGQPNPMTGSKVVLTTAHLDHTPENCRDDNLKAMCQRCHLRYDHHHHTRNARITRNRKAGQDDLFEAPSKATGRIPEAKALPPLHILQEALVLHADGTLTWRERPLEHFKTARDANAWNKVRAGKPAFVQPCQGYFRGVIGGRGYWTHRIVFKLSHGRDPVGVIDHLNGIKTDNHPENLRETSVTENTRNRAMCRRNSSGQIGVSFKRSRRMWRAYIHVDHKMRDLGLFRSKDDAIAARRRAEVEFGYHANHGRRC